MKRLAIIFSLMLFLSVGASQAQAQNMTVTGEITLAYCNYIEFTYTITDAPSRIEVIYVHFLTDTGDEFYSIAIALGTLNNFTDYTENWSLSLLSYGTTLPANTNIQIELYVELNGQRPQVPDYVTGFVSCVAPAIDISIPLPPPTTSLPEDDPSFLFGYNPNAVGYAMSIYPLGGDDEGFQIIGNLGQYLVVTGEELANLPDEPEANMLVAGEEGGYALYYLTTGEFQINSTPTIEGKVLSIIFDLETGEFYTREFNIYDILEG